MNSTLTNSRRIEQVIERIDKMPSLPTVAARILEVVQDGKSAARDLAEVISKDQGFTAKILKLINSAYYSFPYKVATISHAVALLGFETIRSLALGLSIFKLLQGKGEDQPLDREKLWEHSLSTAVWARSLAGHASGVVPEEAFVAGLLHDMGKVLFNEYFRRKFADALQLAERKGISLREAEAQSLGLDHTGAGEIWANRWNLPPLICAAISYHHEPFGMAKTEDLQIKRIVAMVHVADYFSEMRGLGSGGDGSLAPPNQRIWEIIGVSQETCWQLGEEVEQEVQKAKEFFHLVEEGEGGARTEVSQGEREGGEPPDHLKGALSSLSDLVACAVDSGRLLDRLLKTVMVWLEASGVAVVIADGEHGSNVLRTGDVPVSVEQVARRLLATQSAGDEGEKRGLGGPWHPLVEGNRSIGRLWLGRDKPLTAPEEEFLRGASRELIRILKHLEEGGQIQIQSEALTSLIEDSATMTLLRGLDELYPRLAVRGRELAHADAAALYLFENETLTPVASDGIALSLLPSPMPIHEDGWSGWVLATGEPFTVDQLESSPPCPERELFLELGFSSHLILPLEVLGRRLGVLSFHTCPPRRWSGTEVALLSAFTTQAAAAIDNAFLNQSLQGQVEEVKRAQLQLIQSTKLAAVGELAANIAHEINNPLTSVLGYTGLLLKSFPQDDPNRETLQIIESEALRTRRIVRDLLDFSRQRGPDAQPTDLHDVLGSVLVLLRNQIQKAEVEVREVYDPGLPLVVLDAAQMKQVFLNLVTNAIDAMSGGGTLTLTTRVLGDENDASAEVAIQDTGHGMTEEQRAKIFEPFFTTKPEGQGTGLGLSVSLGIVQSHGGSLLVESEVKRGSIFRVRIPLTSVATARS